MKAQIGWLVKDENYPQLPAEFHMEEPIVTFGQSLTIVKVVVMTIEDGSVY